MGSEHDSIKENIQKQIRTMQRHAEDQDNSMAENKRKLETLDNNYDQTRRKVDQLVRQMAEKLTDSNVNRQL